MEALHAVMGAGRSADVDGHAHTSTRFLSNSQAYEGGPEVEFDGEAGCGDGQAGCEAHG